LFFDVPSRFKHDARSVSEPATTPELQSKVSAQGNLAATGMSANTVQDPQPNDYLTMEGMRGQEYSIGIFFFMLAGVAVFVAIILKFVFGAAKEKGLKKGEKILFIWILFGTFAAVIFGAIQLLQGRLF